MDLDLNLDLVLDLELGELSWELGEPGELALGEPRWPRMTTGIK